MRLSFFEVKSIVEIFEELFEEGKIYLFGSSVDDFKKDNSRLIEQEINKQKVELSMENIKLQKYFKECEKHLLRMEQAYGEIKRILPLSHKQYSDLQDEEVKNID